MYRLFSRITNGLTPMASMFEKHVEAEGERGGLVAGGKAMVTDWTVQCRRAMAVRRHVSTVRWCVLSARAGHVTHRRHCPRQSLNLPFRAAAKHPRNAPGSRDQRGGGGTEGEGLRVRWVVAIQARCMG